MPFPRMFTYDYNVDPTPFGIVDPTPEEIALHNMPSLLAWWCPEINYNHDDAPGEWRSRRRLGPDGDLDPIILSLVNGVAPVFNPTGGLNGKPCLEWGAAASVFATPAGQSIIPTDFSGSYYFFGLWKPDDDGISTVIGAYANRDSVTPDGTSWFGSTAAQDVRASARYNLSGAQNALVQGSSGFIGTKGYRPVIFERVAVGSTFTEQFHFARYPNENPGAALQLISGAPRTGSTDPWHTGRLTVGGCFNGTTADAISSKATFKLMGLGIGSGPTTPEIRATIFNYWKAGPLPNLT